MSPSLRTCLLLAALASGCQLRNMRSEPALFTLEDPRGDDFGDGTLRYPLRPDMQPGNLDLLRLEAYAEEGGTRFEATFARQIPVPEMGRTVDVAGGTLASVARNGFYTFNLDLYVDTDGIPGSGRTETLPGRGVMLSSLHAWDKVVVLSPRPFDARDALRTLWRNEAYEARVKNQTLPPSTEAIQAIEGQVETALNERAFFPTRVRVVGRRVEFFVPQAFFGGLAKKNWGYAAAVTGAVLDQRVDLPSMFGGRSSSDSGMMVMGVASGPQTDRFGGTWSGLGQPPVVDLTVPPGTLQQEVLAPNGLPWPAVVPALREELLDLPEAPQPGSPPGQGGAPTPRAP
jgi:hypothetical protein